MKSSAVMIGLIILASSLSSRAAYSWTYVGLKGEAVNTILPMIGYSPDGVMVGTHTGIWNYEYARWVKTWSGLPVHAIIRIPNGNFLAAMGNGSDSDGVYLGTLRAIAEPGTLWKFHLLAKCPRPTALAIAPMDGSCICRVYVGNAEGVRTGMLCQDTLKEIALISGPAAPFGNTCKSLVIGTDDGMLYAGGYDDNPQEGPGGRDTAWLLRGTADKLTALKRMNATSIAELPLQSMSAGGIRDLHPLAVATVDSGIHYFAYGAFWKSYPAPAVNKPVVAVAPFRTVPSLNWTEIIAATATGVFRQCPPNADCVWSKIENLPGTPSCIAQYQAAMLWAGTDSGVYQYEASTSVDRNSRCTRSTARPIRIETGNGLLEIENRSDGEGTISLFTAHGRHLKTFTIPKTRSSVPGIGTGLFLYKITIRQTVFSGRVIVY